MDPFRDLYERYHADVYRFALFLTGDRSNAEDLAADGGGRPPCGDEVARSRDGSAAYDALKNAWR
jgi:hypothetical protein